MLWLDRIFRISVFKFLCNVLVLVVVSLLIVLFIEDFVFSILRFCLVRLYLMFCLFFGDCVFMINFFFVRVFNVCEVVLWVVVR